MKELRSEITSNAPATRVWDTLTALDSFHEWNPFMQRAVGEAKEGRRSGRLHATPVSIVELNGQRWLVAPYGTRNWVRNARAAGQVTLSRAGQSEVATVEEEHDPAQCAQVLKAYLNQEPVTRRFFAAQPESPLEEFAAEALRHPVFLVMPPDRETVAPP